MARQKGTFEFSNNLEVKIAGPLDARTMVSSYSDLLTFTSDNYLINGFTVSVYDTDPNKRGIYQLINQNNLSSASSWQKITSNLTGTSGASGTSGSSGSSGSSGIGDRYRGYSSAEINLTELNPEDTVILYTTPGLSYTVAQHIIIANSVYDYFTGDVKSYNPLNGRLELLVTASSQTDSFIGWITNLDGAAGGDGSSGTSGQSGIMGSSGMSGSSGTSGITGSSGTSGTDYYSYYNSSYSGTTQVPQTVGGIVATTPISTLEGNTFSEVFDKLLFPTIKPDVTLVSSSTIPFNRNNVTIGLFFGYTIKTVGATVSNVTLQYKLGINGTLNTLSINVNDTAYTHNYSYGLNQYSALPLIYIYTVTDSANSSNSKQITIQPSVYITPSVDLSNSILANSKLPIGSPIETNTLRQMGNVSTTLSSPSIVNPNWPDVGLTSYQIQYVLNGGNVWANLSGANGTLPANGNSPIQPYIDNSLSTSANSIQYRLLLNDGYTIFRGFPNVYNYPVINFYYSYYYGYTVSQASATDIQTIINLGYDPNGGSFNSVIAPSTAPLTNMNFNSTGQWIWFAHVATANSKTSWKDATPGSSNFGSIGINAGGYPDLLAAPVIKKVNDTLGYWSNIDFKIYVAQKQTQLGTATIS